MTELTEITLKYDSGGRRLGIDRRQYSYAAHLPERRAGEDRRTGEDRRNLAVFESRAHVERRALFAGS